MILTHLSECVGLFRSAFSLAGRVAQGEDDWMFIEARHVTDDALCEGSRNGGDT